MFSNTHNDMRDMLVECLKDQISEFELLKAMYPNHDEIVLTDNALEAIKEFLENKSDYTPNHLDFCLKLLVNEIKLEVCINLPNFYPKEEPDIYVRCNNLNRQQETSLNIDLSNYIKEIHNEDVCLYSVISWLQENIDIYSFKQEKDFKSVIQVNYSSEDEKKFIRLWVFSHHIYNKKKREEIVAKAKDLNLTGFCLPGKPGVICVEGSENSCKEWWKDIKSMSWKKIGIRKTEIFEPSEQSQHQKFYKFEEIHFQNPTPRHCKHADMSGFSKYMEKHGFSQVFNEFFGLSNDIS